MLLEKIANLHDDRLRRYLKETQRRYATLKAPKIMSSGIEELAKARARHSRASVKAGKRVSSSRMLSVNPLQRGYSKMNLMNYIREAGYPRMKFPVKSMIERLISKGKLR